MKIDIDRYRAFGRMQRQILFTVAFSAEELKHKQLTAFVAKKLGVARKDVGAVCGDFVQRGILREWRGWGGERGFLTNATFTLAVLVAMVNEADEQEWWPKNEELKTFWSDAYYGMSWDRTGIHHERVVSELLRALVLGSDAHLETAMVKAVTGSQKDILRAAAYKYRSLTDEPPVLTDWLGDVFRSGLVSSWLNLAFVAGMDVRPVLREVGKLMDGRVAVPRELSDIYSALCVWTGFREGLDRGQFGGDRFAEGCRLALDGRFAEADKIFRKVWEARKTSETDADNLPVRMLLVTVGLAVKPTKTRPVQLMRGQRCEPQQHWLHLDAVRRYYEIVTTVNRAWVTSWPEVIGGMGNLIRTAGCSESSPLTGHLLLAWDWHFLASGRSAARERAAKVFGIASRELNHGYVNVAGLMLSLMTGAYDAAEAKDLIDAVDARGVWFLPRTEPEPEWKNLVGALAKFLDRHEKKQVRERKTEKSGGSIVWCVELIEDELGENLYEVDEIVPFLRPAGGKEDGSEDSPLYVEDLSKKKYRSYMTDDDLLLAKTLLAAEDSYSYYSRDTYSPDDIELLCRFKNLVIPVYDNTRNGYYERRRIGSRPLRLVKRTCQLAVTTQEDGGLALQVPSWLSRTHGSYVIRKVSDGEYAYVPVDADVLTLADVFRGFGADGKVVLPGVAMQEAGPVLERLTQVIPVAEPEAGSADALKRVRAASDLVLRLDFSEGVLTVRAVVLPVAGNAQMTLDPGLGPAEKVVAGTLGSYVLVRDLAAETAAFGRVRTALAEVEDWYDGRSVWAIEDIGAAIAALGAIKAIEPPVKLEWLKDRRLNVSSVPTSGVALESFRTADEWFSVKGTFKLDDGRVLSVVELLEAMRARRGNYVQLSDGDYLTLTKTMARELDALAAVGRRKGDGVEVTRAAIPMLDGVFGRERDSLALPEAMAKSAEEIRAAFAKRPKVPSTLAAELRPYQEDGFRWLSRLAACGLGACLADDMGLGKTLQVIALLLERAADGASLVIAPSSVCGNWRREIRRFAPTLEPVLAMETPEAAFAAGKRGVVIASYGYLLFHEDDYAGHEWNGVVLDEAQAIKNDASKRARAVKRLKAKFRVAATGTPVENRLGELWSLFDFLNPGLLGTATSFAGRFTQEGRATNELKRTVKPLVLRRLKGDVLDDLPEKTEITIPVVLGEAERSAYEGCRLHALAALSEGDGEQNRISILAELTRLRRFCCHPSLVLGEGEVPSAKMEALVDLLEGLRAGGHRALVFSQFVDYLAIVRRVLEAHGWSYKYLDGSTPTLERGKLVEQFQGGEGDFFLISLKAGGTGLNLTAANYVILLDPWWNPAVENQAADRTHRIGQTQPVTVYRLVAEDTVEERVIELHQQKTAMSADLLDGTSDARFSPEDLMKLFQARG